MLLSCDAGEDSWESLDSNEIKPVNSKGNQLNILQKTAAEAPINFGHVKQKANLLEKILMLG